MAGLSTHILDTVSGGPAAGVRVDLVRLAPDGGRTELASTLTNADGRTDVPLLAPEAVKVGSYELTFHVGAYFRAAGLKTAEPPFLDTVPLRFQIADPARHYHVPLLVSPWSYTTYRGS
jgi:5-hydroxyisourate hydrolase